MDDDLAQQIERERRALLLLARNQDSRQHVEAAGRHVLALGRLLKKEVARAGAEPSPAPARAST